MKEQKEVLEAAARYRNILLGTLGHDMRNPLSAIQLSSSLLEKLDSTETQIVKKRIDSASRRMSKIIDQVLEASVLQAGECRLNYELLDLVKLCKNAIDEVCIVYSERKFTLSCPESEVIGIWDSGRISQVLINLFTNSCKYGTPGTSISVTITPAVKIVTIIVHNYGTIASELLSTIFEPFKAGAQGTGLGLYIAHEHVKHHGGTIEVHSSQADGTAFIIRLPRRPPLAELPEHLRVRNGTRVLS